MAREAALRTPGGLDDVEDLDVLGLYKAEALNHRLLAADEVVDLVLAMRAGDSRARDTLVACNERLVWATAFRWRNTGVPLPDLLQEGRIGLLRALDAFRPELGFRLSTYALWWITQAIRRYAQNHSRSVRVPVHVLESRAQAAAAVRAGDLARLGEYDELTRLLHNCEAASLERSLTADGTPIGSHLPADRGGYGDPEACTERCGPEELSGLLDCLSPKERFVIEHRRGVGQASRAYTLVELAGMFKPPVSREHVRKIEAVAMARLRQAAAQRKEAWAGASGSTA